ncbi:MAG: Transcriptional regulator containing an amidase domain and an AraC-type DNA-binding HTH domain [uncultured Caballeronia sp.]|nr:MAG: Transcriptional regulator containing an amidase domain and an AraC-type DNA-binding HTH domain [uncultured Caballeronia sp.]
MKRDAMVPDRIHPAENSPLSKLVHFGFLTLPNFSMIAFASAIKVLRMATTLAGLSITRGR